MANMTEELYFYFTATILKFILKLDLNTWLNATILDSIYLGIDCSQPGSLSEDDGQQSHPGTQQWKWAKSKK